MTDDSRVQSSVVSHRHNMSNPAFQGRATLSRHAVARGVFCLLMWRFIWRHPLYMIHLSLMDKGNNDTHLQIRLLTAADIQVMADAFTAIGWHKPASQYQRYLAEQEAGERVVLVATVDGDFAGYVTIVWASGYPPFRAAGIPEVVDFNVLPHYRRRKIGTRLMEEAEERIGRRSSVAGIGVGLYPDYGAAQRMYVLRGYIPDGTGIWYDVHQVQPGETVCADDSLALFFTKQLRSSH